MRSIVNGLVAAGLFAFFSFPVFSQSSLREGFIVQSTGDTLRGLVNYRQGLQSFKTCSFKSTPDAAATEFTPGQIQSYGLTGDKIFESQFLTGTDSALVFVEVLARGEANLYRYIETFWLQVRDSELVQLKNETVSKYINGQWIEKNTNEYVATLAMMLKDCQEVLTTLNRVSFSQKSLVQAVERYNVCKGNSYVLNTQRWVNVKIGISAGLTISNLKFESKLENYRSLTRPSPTATSFVPGITVEVGTPRMGERFKFAASILYFRAVYRLHDEWQYGTSTVNDYIEFDIKQLKIPVGVNYVLSQREKIAPFVAGGFTYGYNFGYEVTSVRHMQPGGTTNDFAPTFPQAKSQLGVWGGVGLLTPLSKKHTGSLEFRCERTAGLSATAAVGSVKSRVVNFQFVLAIRKRG